MYNLNDCCFSCSTSHVRRDLLAQKIMYLTSSFTILDFFYFFPAQMMCCVNITLSKWRNMIGSKLSKCSPL